PAAASCGTSRSHGAGTAPPTTAAPRSAPGRDPANRPGPRSTKTSTDPPLRMPAVPACHGSPPDIGPPHGAQTALELFLDEVLQRVVLMRELRVHPLVLAELALQLLQAFQLRRIKPPVLRLPVVVGRRANPVLAPDFLHRHAGIGFPQHRDDLRLRESRLLHQNLLVVVCQKVLLSKCPEEGEAYGSASVCRVAEWAQHRDAAQAASLRLVLCSRVARSPYLLLGACGARAPHAPL